MKVIDFSNANGSISGNSSSGGINPFDYKPFMKSGNFTTVATTIGSADTLININGSGYLTQALLYNKNGIASATTSIGYVQITIDNIVVVKSALASGSESTNSLPLATGFSMNTDGLINYDNVYQQYYGELSPNDYTPKMLVMDTPLYFKSNCKIEYLSTIDGTKPALRMAIVGAYK